MDCVVGVLPLLNGGGGVTLERVGFLKKHASSRSHRFACFGAKNGDFCGESAVTHAQVRAFDSPCKAPFLSPKSNREQVESKAQSTDSSSTILESKATLESKKLDSSLSPSLRDTAPAVARQSTHNAQKSKKVDSSTATILKQSAKDSGIFDKTAQSVFDSHLAGGRICDEKVGLCSLLRGDKTGGLSHKQKANSPLFRAKPTPKPSQRLAL